jgi:[ribosomal protein S5]-alanine N-acetyltransferase
VIGRWGIPVVTERVVLTPLDHTDAPALLAMFREPAVRRYLLDDEVVDRAWVEGEIADSRDRFAMGGLGLWMCCDRGAAATPLGFAGYRSFYDPPVEQVLYGLATSSTHRGLATEVTSAVIDVGFRDPDRTEIRASTDEPNLASIRVLERLGFERVTRAPGPRGAQLHFVLTRERWER